MDENETRLDHCEMAAIMVVFGFLGLILTAVLSSFLRNLCTTMFIIETIFIIVGLIVLEKENSEGKADHVANINAFQKEYNEYVHKLGSVKSDTRVTLIETDEDGDKRQFYNIYGLTMAHYLSFQWQNIT